MTIGEALDGSQSEEWPIPRSSFHLLDEEFGFPLDPCARSDNIAAKLSMCRASPRHDKISLMKEGPGKHVSRRDILRAGFGAVAAATMSTPQTAEASNLKPEQWTTYYHDVQDLAKSVLQKSVEYFDFMNAKSNTEPGEYSRLFTAALNDEAIPDSDDMQLRQRLQTIFTDTGSDLKNYYVSTTALQGLIGMTRRRATTFARLEAGESARNDQFLRYLEEAEARLNATEAEVKERDKNSRQ
jgi:hypothetical protein